MKKEAFLKNKKWLWLAIAIVAVLAVAGVLIAVFVGGNNQDEKTAPTSKLYWNVDRVKFMENSESGLTTREAGDDGLYHVRVATGGELLEVVVSDGRLINYIDTLDAMGLVFDADGTVVDALDPSAFNPEVVRDFFVKRVTDTSLTINSSIAMNGMDMVIDLSEAGVYDVTDSAAQPGMPGVCGLMDRVYVYGDMDGNPTDVFIVDRADSAEVYWPLPGYWNSTKKETTRKPDENGVYTITFAYKGELVDLKCKEKSIVNSIDNTGNVDRCQALKFDEEGYIVATISTQMALKAMRICDRYDILELNGNEIYAKGYFGSTSGKEINTTMLDDCEVYLVCDNGTVQSHIGEKTELQLGDRILCYSDLEGNAKLIYVLNRRVDSPLYFNVYRKKLSQATGNTLRKVDDNGYYVFKLAVDGQMKTYRTKDVKLATALDSYENRGVGLKLKGDIIEAVYEQESVTGNLVAGVERYITSTTGMIVSAALARDITNPANLVMNPDCKIYNVSTDRDGTKIASETTLRPFDQVTMFRNYTGVTHIFVTRRYVEDAKMYWNTEAKLTSDFTETSREPDKEGYYVYTLACDGKHVTVKTKDKDMATYIDSADGKRIALKTTVDPNNKDHQIVKYAYSALSLVKAPYLTSDSYYYDYYNKEENRHYVYYMKGDEKVTGGTKVMGQKNLKTFNISDSFELNKGEKSTIRKDDKVIYIVSQIDWVAHYGFITERKVDGVLAYNKTRMYNTTTKETTRKPDAEGYYVFELAVNGEVKLYKTKSKEIASKLDSYTGAFTLNAKGDLIQGVYYAKCLKGIKGVAVGRFDVTSIDGNTVKFTRNRPTSSNLGETTVKKLAKDCKVYDMSPYAAKWGAETTLGLGDRVEAYSNDDGEICYINIILKCTRAAGPISYCSHCDKEVWWEPYNPAEEYTTVNDLHYYFPGETTVKSVFGVGANEKPVVAGSIANPGSYVNLYAGAKLEGKDLGSSVKTHDTNPIAAQANAQTFPADGSDYKAMCYACNEEVVWKAFTKDCVWHKMYNANYSGDTADAWHSHFYVPNDITVTRKDKSLITNALSGSAAADSTMCIHLNGKTIKSPGEIRAEKSIVNIMGNGTIDVDCTAASNVANGTIYVANSSAKLNLYGGTYKNSSTRIEGHMAFDLNGQKVYTTTKLAQVAGNVELLDTVGNGTLATKSAKSALGGVITVENKGVVNMHSGTLTSVSTGAAANGGVVFVYEGGTFNMLGGAITGATAVKGGNVCVAGTFNMNGGTISNGTAADGSKASNGGNVMVYMGGTFNMNGGTIQDGSGSGSNVYIGDATFNLKNGTISGGTNGVSVRMMDAATFNMSGGTVTGGSGSNGGNFYLQATNGKKGADGKQVLATLNLTGGTVSNGTATTAGGNISLQPNGKLVHTGGIITGGTAPVGGNIAVNTSITSRATLGGTITNGEVYIAKSGTTTLTGKVAIDNLKIESGVTVALDNLTTTEKAIKIDATGAFTTANEKYAEYTACFEAMDPVKYIFVKDNKVNCNLAPTVCPACGDTVNWTKISEKGRISSSLGIKHWVLDDDFTYTGNLGDAIIFNKEAGFVLCVDLNGKTLTSGNGIQASNGTLNLFNGSFVMTSESTSGSIGTTAMYLTGSAVVNMKDVNIKSTVASDSAINMKEGAPVVNISGSTNVDGNILASAGTLTLDGAATVKNIVQTNAKIVVKQTFTGSAVADLPLNEAVTGEPGWSYVDPAKVEVEGAFTGTLKTSDGKTYIPVETTVSGGTIYRLKVNIDAHFHSHTPVVTAPTCTTKGYTTYTCACGHSYVDDEVDATGHPDVNDDKECDVCFQNLNNPGQAGINLGKSVKEKSAALKATFEGKTGDVTALCPVCNTEVTWKAWTVAQNTNLTPADGTHYYLAENMGKILYGPASGTACVNLNGKTLRATNPVYAGAGTLNILDTNGAGMVIGTRANQGKGAAIFFDNTAKATDAATSVVNLFGGTYTKNADNNASAVMIDGNGGTLNMYEGAAIDMTGRAATGTSGAYGLSVWLRGASGKPATFNMYGGSIINGNNPGTNNTVGNIAVGYVATGNGVFNMYAGEVKDGTAAYGGNFYVWSSGKLNLYDGAISNGTATTSGGNICIAHNANGAEVNVYGGAILGGTAQYGGNICFRATENYVGRLTMTGGYIMGGTATQTSGHTIYLGDYNTAVNFTMSGGTIVGQVRGKVRITANISGPAKMLRSYTYGGVTYTATAGLANCGFTVADLGPGAEIWCEAALNVCYKYCETCGAAKKYTLKNSYAEVESSGSGHYVYNDGAEYKFICK